MHTQKHILRSSALCLIVIAIVALPISTVLPWLAQSGFAGEVIESSYENQRDATPLFYSESDRTWEILSEVEANQVKR
jgi:hypothetical protein